MGSKRETGFEEVETAVMPARSGGLPENSSTFSVRVIGGPDIGRTFAIVASLPSRVLVGQSPSCEFRLTDPQVSRRHLALEHAGMALRVTDLDSTNGTRVNGTMIVEVFVVGGERVELGATALQIQRFDIGGADQPLPNVSCFGKLLGASREMRRLYPLCERLAASNVPVVIEGETGTGKEVLAEALHEEGPRALGPFVVFDCTAVPPNLVESALFGHERGAFTGATETRKGVFEQAHGGTLLIDEIGDLEIGLQAKLLRALERSEVRRVGGATWMRVDVRVLAATRRNLDQEVQAGRFRDDLFFRLAVARIELPPLRRRHGDVDLLARSFWRRLADPGVPITADFLARLEDYSWPGNVRELHNAVARRVALGELADGNLFDAGPAGGRGDCPVDSRRSAMPVSQQDTVDQILALNLSLPSARERLVADFERRYVQRVLDMHGGNIAKAAEASGIARRYFQLLRARSRQRDEDG